MNIHEERKHSAMKHLKPVVIAGSLISGAASAQTSVTLYGVVDNAFAYVNNQRGNSNIYMSQGNLQASKFGLLGAEDLGGGTKAIFRLESGFRPARARCSSVRRTRVCRTTSTAR